MKAVLIDNQIVLSPMSGVKRAMAFVSDVVLALLTIACIAVISISVYVHFVPRVTYDITRDVVLKACGVPA